MAKRIVSGASETPTPASEGATHLGAGELPDGASLPPAAGGAPAPEEGPSPIVDYLADTPWCAGHAIFINQRLAMADAILSVLEETYGEEIAEYERPAFENVFEAQDAARRLLAEAYKVADRAPDEYDGKPLLLARGLAEVLDKLLWSHYGSGTGMLLAACVFRDYVSGIRAFIERAQEANHGKSEGLQ